MGQKLSHRSADSEAPPLRQVKEQLPSPLYAACRNGNIDKVKNLLASMSNEQINRYEPNGSTPLHVASYYGHVEIVQMLIDAGANRSIRNLRFNLTAYQEARNDNIRQLLTIVNLPTQSRFIGSSSKIEWSLDTSLATEWKSYLSSSVQPKLSLQEIISFLQETYLTENLTLSPNDLEKILWFFRLASKENNATFIIKAYTSPTQFYALVNNHFAQHLAKCFRIDSEQSPIEKCVTHLASIFIHRSELKSLSYTGTVYRGLLLLQADLEVFVEQKCLLNKSFLSTSKERSIASNFSGVGRQKDAKGTGDQTSTLQYNALCIYQIKNPNTALDISKISEISSEQEVLIMPLCVFQVKSIRRVENNNNIQIEILLEELNEESIQSENVSTTTKITSDINDSSTTTFL